MKLAKVAFTAAIALLVAGLFTPPAQAGVSFSAFYSSLSPYGSWQVSAQYGRVWQPSVYSAGWNPYYDGHWVYSDLGWTWVSDYEWGAIPYHYGTWVADPYYGWVWVPGYTWAPSWVVFRTGPDYIGWAPVSPGFSVGFSVGYGAPTASPFVFVSAGNFLAPRIRSCYVPPSRTTVIVNNTRIVNNLVIQNNVVVNRGFDPRIVERASGRRVREVPIEGVARVMSGPRVSRAEFRVDPERAQHGLRAAEPVSEKQSIPDSARRAGGNNNEGRQRESVTTGRATGNVPRAPRRESGDIERRGGGSAPTDNTTANVPRAPRRMPGDVERRDGGLAPMDRAGTDAARARRQATGGNGMKGQEDSTKVYRERSTSQYRVPRTNGPDAMSPERQTQGETRSMQQPGRQTPGNRQPGSVDQGTKRSAASPRAKTPEHKQDKKSHDSDKNSNEAR